MKQLIISAILLVVTQFSYGQTVSTKEEAINSKEAESSVYQKRLSQQFTTMKIDLSSFSRTDIGDLNNELINYNGKVTSVVYDDITRIMAITHNALIAKDDMYQIIAKHHIKKTSVLSYQ